MRTVLTTLLLAFLLTFTAEAQPGPPDHARPIEGVILVKFAPDALETPPQQLRPSELNLQGRQAARLRQLLSARRGPGQKLFRNFMPADTLGRHIQSGEQVRLKDLSRWYRFPVRNTTNVDTRRPFVFRGPGRHPLDRPCTGCGSFPVAAATCSRSLRTSA